MDDSSLKVLCYSITSFASLDILTIARFFSSEELGGLWVVEGRDVPGIPRHLDTDGQGLQADLEILNLFYFYSGNSGCKIMYDVKGCLGG